MSSLLEYKCPSCSGAIRFDSSLQKVVCPYCDTEFEISTLIDLEDQLKSVEPDDHMEWEEPSAQVWSEDEIESLGSYVCQSCGGEIIGDANTAATSCPFCSNPVVFKQNLSGSLRPDFILPFQLDKDAAMAAFKEHLSGKKLLPKAFSRENHIQEIKGIYVPFWLYDSSADASVRYLATRVRHWSDAHYFYTDTSYYSVIRDGNLTFEKIPADGSKRIDDTLMESVEPFDYSMLRPFEMPYLAGFYADKYDVTAQENQGRINERIRQSAVNEFAKTVVGYSSVTPQESSIRLRKNQTSYALLPVWFLNTTWRDQTYTFAMNGQTGEFVGDLPMDKGAFARHFILTWVIVFVVLLVLVMIGLYLG